MFTRDLEADGLDRLDSGFGGAVEDGAGGLDDIVLGEGPLHFVVLRLDGVVAVVVDALDELLRVAGRRCSGARESARSRTFPWPRCCIGRGGPSHSGCRGSCRSLR